VDCGSGNWCCAADAEDGSCDCSTGNGTFTIPQGVAQTIISVSSLQSTDTAAATSTSDMSTTTSTAGTTLTTSTASSSQTISRTSKTSSTGTTPTSSPTGSAVAKKTSVTSTVGFKAGVGLGGAAIAAILGFLAFWFCCKGKSGRRSTMDFASRSSSAGPAYTPVTAAYDTGRAEYGPFNAASVYGSPIPTRDPEPYHSSYSAPSPLLRPDADERPVTPEEDYRSNRFPMMATLPREGP
jgi:hypothetical protein